MSKNVKQVQKFSKDEHNKGTTYFYLNKFYTIWSWFDFCENL